MKVKKTMKYKKNKKSLQIGGIFGFNTDINKMLIDEGAKKYINKLLLDRGLRQEKADEITDKIFSNPKIAAKLNTLVANIKKAETRWMTQGRHLLVGAIPFEIGDILNAIIDGIINTIDAGKQAKSAYQISQDIEKQIVDLPNIPKLPTSTGATLGSRAMGSINKIKARGTAAAAAAKGKATAAAAKGKATAAAAAAKGKAAAAAAKGKATAAAAKGKATATAKTATKKGGTKKRHKKNKKTRKYRKKLSKKH